MQPRSGGIGRLVEAPEGHVVGDAHARDAGVAQRLLRQERHAMAQHLGAPRAIGLAVDAHFARGRVALARQHLDQLALAVARHAGNAARSRRRAPTSVTPRTAGSPSSSSASSPSSSRHCACPASDARPSMPRISWSPTIILAMASGPSDATGPPPTMPPAAQHRHLVGERHHLAELVGDDEDGDAAPRAPCRGSCRGSRRPRSASAPRSARRE